MNAITELERLQELLLLEREEDFEQFKNMVQSLPLERRIEKGLTWHPVEILRTGYSIGDRAYVTVKRLTHTEQPHQFRSGGTVSLFTSHPAVKRGERSGVIHYVDRQKMKIILNSNDLPDWLDQGLIGVDMLFDETTYVEMQRALKKVMKAKGNRLAELRDILLGHQQPEFNPITQRVQHDQLNASQNNAIDHLLAARETAIIHGPPGTGKTTTLVQALQHLTQREGTILVCAPSNAAVDLLTERIAKAGMSVVRMGNISRVDEELVQHTLDGRLADHPEMKHIKKIQKQAADARRKAQRFRRSFGPSERRERHELYQEARELSDWANQMEHRLVERILSTADVITCTLVGANGKYVEHMKFQTLIIDEAAQALEPATWIPITKASRVFFFGDPLQLPPTVKSQAAKRGGFDVTLMEKGLERNADATFLLNTQYRMHQQIMDFSNAQFYHKALQADASVAAHTLDVDTDLARAVEFIDTAGCGFEEQLNPEYQSRFNPDEYHILREHLYPLLAAFAERPLPSIGIISPYREQVIHIKEAIAEDPALADLPLDVNTIDGFQGQERDVIYISLVRSNTKGEIGFLKDYRRMNVAMTRARKKLVIIGDSATLGTDDFYQSFLSYCERIDGYRTAWEFMA